MATRVVGATVGGRSARSRVARQQATVANDVDLGRVTAYLDAERPGLRSGELHAWRLAGGRSHLNIAIADRNQRWVLRRPVRGAGGDPGRDLEREHWVLTALARSYVPVPRPVLHCADESVIGVPFLLTEFVPGRVLRTTSDLAAVGPRAALLLAQSLAGALAILHRTDPAVVGLSYLGDSEGYAARQVQRWKKLVDSHDLRRLPATHELGARLERAVPVGPSALVHGDFRLENIVLDDGGMIAAILDWEMATEGDPLVDLAYASLWWDGFEGLGASLVADPGESRTFPPSSYLIDRYASATDIAVGDLGWYRALAYLKCAAICAALHRRHVHGNAVGPEHAGLGDLVEPLAERGLASLEGSRSVGTAATG